MKPEDKEQELDQRWQALSEDWQAQETVHTDIQALIINTQKRVRKGKICFVANIIFTLCLIGYVIFSIWQGKSEAPFTIYSGLLAIFSTIVVFWEWRIRIKVWRSYNESPDKAIETAIDNAKVSMQYMRLSKWCFYVVIPLLNWYAYTVMEQKEKHELLLYVIANGLMLILYFIYVVLYLRRKKEYQSMLKLM